MSCSQVKSVKISLGSKKCFVDVVVRETISPKMNRKYVSRKTKSHLQLKGNKNADFPYYVLQEGQILQKVQKI